ncbi:MAG: hypothetical protein EP330_02160 [Deltaproteobacteria bacterium]|nr:MAG: hypothetical protein EP330_02160 [Deltaproteobacteria bacterium]
MQIQSESRIAHPIDKVFPLYRDRLPEVVPYIPDVSEINVLAREEGDGVVKLHNEWVSDREIPSVVSKFIKPEHLRWDDFATWREADTTCSWELKTRAFTEAVTCTGQTQLIADGDQTLVRLTGDFQLDVSKVKGVPSFLAKRIAPQLEKFIVSLVTPNLERVNGSLQQFLDEQG